MCSFSRNLSLHSVQPRSRLKTVVVVETQPGFVNNNNNDDNDNNNNNNSDNAYFVILSTEDMILALAGQFKQLSHEPEKFR